MLSSKNKKLQKLFLFYKKNRNQSIKNKFFSKSLCFKANFSNTRFENVNFKGAILTSCCFKKAHFYGVDFLGTNLKKSNFSNSIFDNCLFVNTILRNSNFKSCIFSNCIFVNTNTQVAKSLELNESNTILKKYPSVDISSNLMNILNQLKENKNFINTRIIHLKGGKINGLTINLLIKHIPDESLLEKKLLAVDLKLNKKLTTFNSLLRVIDSINFIE